MSGDSFSLQIGEGPQLPQPHPLPPSTLCVLVWPSTNVNSAHLWYENKDARFACINNVTYGINAGSIVMAIEETVLYKLVVLDVLLHALP